MIKDSDVGIYKQKSKGYSENSLKIGTGSFFNYGERLIQEEEFEKSLKK